MRQWVLSFPYPLRFLFASRLGVMGRVLGIVYRVIATHLIKQAGFPRKAAHTGAVTLIQCFGSALNLNIHCHRLFLDGVYVERPDGSVRLRWVKAPSGAELTQLAHTIARRVGRVLERQGLLERDAENSYLPGEAMDRPGPRRLDRDSDLVSGIFRLNVLEREGEEGDPEKATESLIGVQGERGTGRAEG